MVGDAERVGRGGGKPKPYRLSQGKGVQVPPTGWPEPIGPRRVQGAAVLRAPQGVRPLRETGGGATWGIIPGAYDS